MSDSQAIRGDLQREIMRVLWSAGTASVEEVRMGLPARKRGAYTTVQTVLNRLADRGLVDRKRTGRAIQYAAKVSEADYVARSLQRALKGASDVARRSALANLVEDLPSQELEAIREIAGQIQGRRQR